MEIKEFILHLLGKEYNQKSAEDHLLHRLVPEDDTSKSRSKGAQRQLIGTLWELVLGIVRRSIDTSPLEEKD